MFKKGEPSAFKGRHHTPEAKAKLSIVGQKPNKGQFKKGVSSWNKGLFGKNNHSYGKPRSLEVKRKISNSRKGMKFAKAHIKNMSKAILGEKHWNWQGGKTEFRELIRTNKFYIAWRKSILKRDNFTCQFCNKKITELNVDHYPKSFKSLIKDNKITSLEQALECKALFDINNGRTLCINCHKQTSNYGGIIK